MRVYVYILLLSCSVYAQKRFQPEYFAQKHNLLLPELTKEMLDVSKCIHTSDAWEYFYMGNSSNLDSVVRNLTIEGFEASRRLNNYIYMGDSVIVMEISLSKKMEILSTIG